MAKSKFKKIAVLLHAIYNPMGCGISDKTGSNKIANIYSQEMPCSM
jgi:hypothetical protein